MTGGFFRVRSRLSFVRRSRFRPGVVGPLAVAVALAVAGYSVSTGDAAASVLTSAYAPEVPERHAVSAAPTQVRHNAVARKEPKRASRSVARRPVATAEWVRPSRGALTSGYGPRWGRMHRGIDFGASYGSPIYAAASGVVSFAGAQSGYGRLVTIRHQGGYVTAYGHMSRTVVRSGQRVSAGQVIAYVGSEGRSTGPHLHFEVRRGGAYLNPLPFLRERGVRV